MLNHYHNQKKQHLKYRNWVVDCWDWPPISATIPSLESIYSVSIQPCLLQGCCHSECLAFTPFDGYLKLWEFNMHMQFSVEQTLGRAELRVEVLLLLRCDPYFILLIWARSTEVWNSPDIVCNRSNSMRCEFVLRVQVWKLTVLKSRLLKVWKHLPDTPHDTDMKHYLSWHHLMTCVAL